MTNPELAASHARERMARRAADRHYRRAAELAARTHGADSAAVALANHAAAWEAAADRIAATRAVRLEVTA